MKIETLHRVVVKELNMINALTLELYYPNTQSIADLFDGQLQQFDRYADYHHQEYVRAQNTFQQYMEACMNHYCTTNFNTK